MSQLMNLINISTDIFKLGMTDQGLKSFVAFTIDCFNSLVSYWQSTVHYSNNTMKNLMIIFYNLNTLNHKDSLDRFYLFY